jgi:hypothetical protein
MTSISAAAQRVADSTPAPTQPQQPTAPVEGGAKLVVDDRSNVRLGLRIAGGVVAAAGAVVGGVMLLRHGSAGGAVNAVRTPLILGGSIAGAGLLGLGAASFVHDRVEDALAAGTTPEDVRAQVATLGRNVTVVKAVDGSFAAIDGKTPDLDAHSSDSPSLPTKNGDLPVDSYVTRFGDVLASTIDGSEVDEAPFVNRGVPAPGVDLDAIRIDPKTGPGAALSGTQLGIGAGDRPTKLGAPVGDAAGYDSPQLAARDLYERGIDRTALITAGGRTWAYQVDGDPTKTAAKGTQLKQLGALTFQEGTDLLRFPQAGEAVGDVGDAATFDLSKMKPEELVGHRLGTAAGTVVRVGARVLDPKGYASSAAAGVAAHAASPGGSTAIVNVGGKAQAYEIDGLPGGAAARSIDVSRLLAPIGNVGLQQGPKLFAANADGALGFNLRLTPFSSNEPIGRPLGGPGAPSRLLSSYANRAAGLAAIKARGMVDDVYSGHIQGVALVDGKSAVGDGSYLYQLGGAATGAAWDREMGGTAVLRRTHDEWSDEREESGETIWRYEYSQTKAILDSSIGGGGVLRDSGQVLEDRSIDYSATSALRAQREREREEARQRELERQRQAEAERQRQAEEQRQAEQQRQAEAERQREADRQAEAERQREAERNSQSSSNSGNSTDNGNPSESDF